MFKTIKALVLREVRYKEADRILTLLSAEEGKLTAKARGALRKSSRTGAATQQLTYAEMTLFANKGKWTVNEASVLEGFDGLRTDLEAFALGSYFAECLEALSVEDEPDAELMQLGLNSLYALSRGLCEARLIKAAFELRLMCLSGYAPDLTACACCGGEPRDPVFHPSDGRVYCRTCPHGGGTLPLGGEALAAMRYISSAPAKKLLSFSLGDEGASALAAVAESYLLRQTERRFGTLDYYKQVRLQNIE
ncbi:MAG: DNA repair protein RecO [Oscillospiraceae bacterium]|nr:DNA repair protein RecO [Oscillospiraceae bacterium]